MEKIFIFGKLFLDPFFFNFTFFSLLSFLQLIFFFFLLFRNFWEIPQCFLFLLIWVFWWVLRWWGKQLLIFLFNTIQSSLIFFSQNSICFLSLLWPINFNDSLCFCLVRNFSLLFECAIIFIQWYCDYIMLVIKVNVFQEWLFIYFMNI